MNKKQVISRVEAFVRDRLSGEGTGHDWWHIFRVLNNAKKIAKIEGGDLFIIELAALTHDLDDWKFIKPSQTVDVRKLLFRFGVDAVTSRKVLEITSNISFKLGTNKYKMKTIEGKVVQDADRLDAIGAIGIARLFAFGGSKGREIHNPEKQVVLFKTLRNFKWNTNTSLHHFEQKMLFIKDRMNTKTARKLALQRHEFMKKFLKEFHWEWNETN